MAQLRRYELTDAEWSIIDPLLPRKSRGVARVDDRHVVALHVQRVQALARRVVEQRERVRADAHARSHGIERKPVEQVTWVWAFPRR